MAVITHRRAASLRRLLSSMSAAHYVGDTVDVSFSLEAGADAATVAAASSWEWVLTLTLTLTPTLTLTLTPTLAPTRWAHGSKAVRLRVRKGGLIGAVVESWYP